MFIPFIPRSQGSNPVLTAPLPVLLQPQRLHSRVALMWAALEMGRKLFSSPPPLSHHSALSNLTPVVHGYRDTPTDGLLELYLLRDQMLMSFKTLTSRASGKIDGFL